MKTNYFKLGIGKAILSFSMAFATLGLNAQSNVYDDVIAISPNHTYLKAALDQEMLAGALQNNAATLTVFAPDNTAFDNLAAQLNTDIAGLLALENLSDVLLYHVLGVTAESGDITNGDIVTPLNNANTIKLTKTSAGDVYANQAMVNAPNLTTDNGVVHSTNAVLLPYETVVDIALDNGFTTLATAVVTAELLPALTDPFADYTVFAPDNASFDAAVASLGIDIPTLLGLSELSDILLYHVLGASVASTDITNGDLADPLNTSNSIKLTKTSNGSVYANQAMVNLADLTAANGVVHTVNSVLLPNETVVDVALDNGFSTLATAVITAELLPALTDPYSKYTVFAPDNAAFDNLASDLGTDINGILALPFLSEVLLYHVVSGTVLSTDLMNGTVPTLNGETVTVDLTSGVMINSSTVTLANVEADNGVVHVINQVLLPSVAEIEESQILNMKVYPNPAYETLGINNTIIGEYEIFNAVGAKVISGSTQNGPINISNLDTGNYFVNVVSQDATYQAKFIKR